MQMFKKGAPGQAWNVGVQGSRLVIAAQESAWHLDDKAGQVRAILWS